MNVLIACEESGRVRDAFNAAGWDAWSCDLLPTRGRQANHLQGDVRWAIDGQLGRFPNAVDMRTGNTPLFRRWDMMIAFPDCTNLTVSGLHWNKRRPQRAELTERDMEFVRYLMDADIPRIAVENPVGAISTRIRRPDQIIQPYEFGDDASKKTCLWLKNLPPLAIDPEARCRGRLVEWPKGSGRMVERWGNQTDSGQNRLAPSPTRARDRAETYPGIAAGMVASWGRAWAWPAPMPMLV